MNRILRHLELVREKVPDWKAYPFSIEPWRGCPALSCIRT
jgi:hypothetical protein